MSYLGELPATRSFASRSDLLEDGHLMVNMESGFFVMGKYTMLSSYNECLCKFIDLFNILGTSWLEIHHPLLWANRSDQIIACSVSIKRGKSETLRWKERIPIYGVVGVDVLKDFEHFECLAWQRKNIQTYSIGKSKNEKSTNQRSSRWSMMNSEQNGETQWLFWSKLGATCLVPLIRVVWSSWSWNVQ